MSVLATAKPGRRPAGVPGRGPRRVDQTLRRHMVLLPEHSEAPDVESAADGPGSPDEGAAVRRLAQDGVAARMPIRAIVPAGARPATGPVQVRRPVTSEPAPQPAAATVAEPSVGAHALEAFALVSPAVATGAVHQQNSTATAPRTASVVAPERAARPVVRERPESAVSPGRPAAARRGWSFARLPRRGQRLLVGAGFALAIGVGAIAGDLAGLGAEVPAGTAVVTVEPGESLWQIASATVEPGTDLRPVIDHIRDLNNLEGSVLVDGQRLLVPAAGD